MCKCKTKEECPQINSHREYIKKFRDAVSSDDTEETFKISNGDKKRLKQAFKIALETRRFEIEMYWKRANYFWLFVAAIFIAWYTLQDTNKELPAILDFLVIGLGIIVSFCWFCVNRGSKFWQENWEQNIGYLSQILNIPIFGIISNYDGSAWMLNQKYPYSVSKVNQIVSLFVTIFWIALGYYQVCDQWLVGKSIYWLGWVGGIAITSLAILLPLIVVHYASRSFIVKTIKKGNDKFFFRP